MGKDSKKSGLSNAVKVRYGGGYGRPTKEETVTVNKSGKKLEQERKKERDYVAGMVFDFS
jgi:hypothetical protein